MVDSGPQGGLFAAGTHCMAVAHQWKGSQSPVAPSEIQDIGRTAALPAGGMGVAS